MPIPRASEAHSCTDGDRWKHTDAAVPCLNSHCLKPSRYYKETFEHSNTDAAQDARAHANQARWASGAAHANIKHIEGKLNTKLKIEAGSWNLQKYLFQPPETVDLYRSSSLCLHGECECDLPEPWEV